jgi:hypothetical protein
MILANVYVGSVANDGTGDTLRSAFQTIDQNFANILAQGNSISGVTTVAGRTGNVVLTVNDVVGAASTYYVASYVSAGNAYVDAQVAALGNIAVVALAANINTLNANVANLTSAITSTNSNAATLTTNFNANIMILNAAIASTNSNVSTVISNLNSTNSNVSTVISNLNSTNSNIANITANVTTLLNNNSFANLVVSGNITASGASFGNSYISGNSVVLSELFVGAPVYNNLQNVIAIFHGTSGLGPANEYTQVAIINSTNNGSTDLALYSDNGNTNGGWVDIGIAGSQFSDTAYTITNSNDGYVIAQSPSTAYGGNLVLATGNGGSTNDIVFATNGFLSNNEIARFHGNASSGGTVFTVLGNIVAGNVRANVSYTMGNYQNWTSNVTTVSSALDQLAARLKVAGF